MRFSLGTVGDVEVVPGTTLAECRPALDELLGPAAGGARDGEGVPLSPGQVAGVPPWVAGSHVEVGRPPGAAGTGPERLAAAPWHVAVVAGPDAGTVAAPGPDGRLVAGRAAPAGGAARLALTDPAVSRVHVELTEHRRGVRARDLGSANGTAVRRRATGRRGRGNGPGARWRRRLGPGRPPSRARRIGAGRLLRLRAGDRLLLGDTELELRRDVAAPAEPGRPEPRANDAGEASHLTRSEPGAMTGRVATALVPLLLAGAMAAVTHSPVFLLMALTGPLVVALPAVAARLARRRATAPPEPGLGPDAADLVVLLARGHTGPPRWWPLAREGLAVTGSGEARAAAARVLTIGAVLDPSVRLTLVPATADAHGWCWARWLAVRLGGSDAARVGTPLRTTAAPTGKHLLVAEAAPVRRADLDRWWLAGTHLPHSGATDGTPRTGARPADPSTDPGPPERAAVVLVPEGTAPPPWCRWVLDVHDDGRATLTGPGGTRPVPAPAASHRWAEEQARRVAARDESRDAPGRDLPRRVGPADVGLPGDVGEVTHAWGGAAIGRRPLPGLRVPIGLAAGPDGTAPAWLDLVADGPHALVAGTTGAGKSELLQALVLGLALRHPPAELALALLDFKGGAGLRSCLGLPHVVGHVSDLDREQAVRALEGLSAELRRRESLLAAAGVSDVEELRALGRPEAPAPPRLLVVVDEFRALAEDLPDFVPGLVRLAAQGRSLGMHLVLATQRPAGAVTAQMRANLALRVCLRVTDPAESNDVVDVPDAAALPARAPGRAVVRRADGAPQVVQTTWMALACRAPVPVRPARPWSAFGREWADPAACAPGRAEDLTALARAAADRLHLPRPEPVWSPPLPTSVGPAELATAVAEHAPSCGHLVLGVTDPPGAGRRGLLEWDGRGLLVVAGAGGSGRTTAAARAATEALAHGWHVHAVGPVTGLLPPGAPGLGTVLEAPGSRLVARLLGLLAAGVRRPTLLVVDEVAALVDALERTPRAFGADLLERLARDARRLGLGLLVTGHPRDVARLVPLATTRLVLPVADQADDAVLGVPRDLSGRRAPGRGVVVAGGAAVRCQVALPAPDGAALRAASGRSPAGNGAVGAAEPGGTGPLRLRPIPEVVEAADVDDPACPADRGAGDRWSVPIGLGGDTARPVVVDARRGVLVVGPVGTGRSTALTHLAGELVRSGLRVGVVASHGPLADLADAAGLPIATTTQEARSLVDPRGPADPRAVAPTVAATPGVLAVPATPVEVLSPPGPAQVDHLDALVVDDLDVLTRTGDDLDEHLARWVHATERGEPAPAVLAAARTDRAAAAYRGALAALRGAAAVVLLDPAEPGSAEVTGTDLAGACDPDRPRHPGRGAVVVRGRATPVQVARPGALRSRPALSPARSPRPAPRTSP